MLKNSHQMGISYVRGDTSALIHAHLNKRKRNTIYANDFFIFANCISEHKTRLMTKLSSRFYRSLVAIKPFFLAQTFTSKFDMKASILHFSYGAIDFK